MNNLTPLYILGGICGIIYIIWMIIDYKNKQNKDFKEDSEEKIKYGNIFKIYKKNDDIELFKKYLSKKDYLMTATELMFYRKLKEYLKDTEYIIFTQVKLDNVIQISNFKNFERTKVFNKIKSKHIDFVITDSKGLIIHVIELDDYRHEKKDKSHITKNNIFEAVGLELIRIPVNKEYNFIELLPELINYES